MVRYSDSYGRKTILKSGLSSGLVTPSPNKGHRILSTQPSKGNQLHNRGPKMAQDQNHGPLLTVTFDKAMPYEWSIGKYGSRFFREIRDHKRFVGIRCPDCEKVYVPPRRLCGPCFKELVDLVPLPNSGHIMGYTVVNYPFIDPETGEQRPIPYAYCYIKIEGADSIFSHFLKPSDIERIEVGVRVRAVFKEKSEMMGNIRDIKYFEIIEDPADDA